MICNFPISIKVSPRDNMMNVENFTKFFLCNITTAASKTVPFSGFHGLFVPVGTAFVFVTPKPCGTVGSTSVSRFSLPLKATFYTTKDIFSNLASQSINDFATSSTTICSTFNKLRVVFTISGMIFSILSITFTRTKSKIKPVVSTFLPGCWFSTDSTDVYYLKRDGSITALGRAIFLSGVFTLNMEGFFTLWAFSHKKIYHNKGGMSSVR